MASRGLNIVSRYPSKRSRAFAVRLGPPRLNPARWRCPGYRSLRPANGTMMESLATKRGPATEVEVGRGQLDQDEIEPVLGTSATNEAMAPLLVPRCAVRVGDVEAGQVDRARRNRDPVERGGADQLRRGRGHLVAEQRGDRLPGGKSTHGVRPDERLGQAGLWVPCRGARRAAPGWRACRPGGTSCSTCQRPLFGSAQ